MGDSYFPHPKTNLFDAIDDKNFSDFTVYDSYTFL